MYCAAGDQPCIAYLGKLNQFWAGYHPISESLKFTAELLSSLALAFGIFGLRVGFLTTRAYMVVLATFTKLPIPVLNAYLG